MDVAGQFYRRCLGLTENVRRLTANHARPPGRPGQLRHHLGRARPILRVSGQQLKRQRPQSVPRQNRHRLSELLVTRGLPATDVVVVHRRKIVVDQAKRVNALDRCGRGKGFIRTSAR